MAERLDCMGTIYVAIQLSYILENSLELPQHRPKPIQMWDALGPYFSKSVTQLSFATLQIRPSNIQHTPIADNAPNSQRQS